MNHVPEPSRTYFQNSSMSQSATASREAFRADRVGDCLRSDLSDADREARIKYCGEQMEACMARYEASSDFGDRAEADMWKLSMYEAINSRTPERVLEMEIERGLT